MAKIETIVDIPRHLRDRDAKITVYVKYRGVWRVRMGLRFIQLGCWISGLGYRETESYQEGSENE